MFDFNSFIIICTGKGSLKKLFNLFIFGCVVSLFCVWVFSSCGEWGLLFVEVLSLLIVVASLIVEHRL